MSNEREMSPYSFLCEAIIDDSKTKDDVAYVYAMLIAGGYGGVEIPNRAIVDRWSESCLQYIKDKAWSILMADEERQNKLLKFYEKYKNMDVTNNDR